MLLRLAMLAMIAALSAGAASPQSAWDAVVARAARDGLYSAPYYEAFRDPELDLETAVGLATAQGKRIILEIGGDWCVACHVLDAYLIQHADVRAAFKANFIMVKVNYSKENDNAEFLSRYPAAKGYPHFYVLESSGALVTSYDVNKLQDRNGFNRKRMLKFADTWRPGRSKK